MKYNRSFLKTALIIYLILLPILILVGYKNFSHHKDTVVRQQQEHLLTIAKSISSNINVYFNDKTDNLYLLSQNLLITDTLNENKGLYQVTMQDFYKKYGDEMESVSLLNDKGMTVYKYPEDSNKTEITINASTIDNVLKNKKAFITKEYEIKPSKFVINILQPVVNHNEVTGILVSTININKLYKSLIDPIKAGKKGYAMIKNREGIIVMHPVTDQIGIESIRVRKERFPEFDWKELEDLNRKQLEEKEGYHIYHSKWWQDNELKWIKKVSAYTTIQKDSISWIISVQMDYSEIDQPIKGTLINISLIAVIIIIFILITTYIIFKIDKERKALEIEAKYLKELNKAWDKLIKSEARLRHSQKLQTIGMLTSAIAHEFRNLLSPILGYSEIILENIDSDESITEDVIEIKKSALRGKEIIEQILKFSRNENGIDKFELLEIEYVIKESIKLIKPIIPNNIKIVENISSSHMVLGSATQLEQVFINLYTNSYHAMKKSGGILEINVERLYINSQGYNELNLGEGTYVKIQVKDTGVGMDKEILSQIFDPFFTTKETGEGTGIGLSVVQGIVKRHNGNIIFKSHMNVGTVAEIYLPSVKYTKDV